MSVDVSLLPIIATLAAQGASAAEVPPAPPAADPVTADESIAQGAEAPPVEELTPPPPPVDWQEVIKDDLVTQIIDGRRRPGYTPDLPDQLTQDNVGALRPPPPQAFPGIEDQLPIPDRWRLIGGRRCRSLIGGGRIGGGRGLRRIGRGRTLRREGRDDRPEADLDAHLQPLTDILL